jgi:hypothetical protein
MFRRQIGQRVGCLAKVSQALKFSSALFPSLLIRRRAKGRNRQGKEVHQGGEVETLSAFGVDARTLSSGGMEPSGSSHDGIWESNSLIHSGFWRHLLNGGDQSFLSLLPFLRRECHAFLGNPEEMEALSSGPSGESGFGKSEESGDSRLGVDWKPGVGLGEERQSCRYLGGLAATGVNANAEAVPLELRGRELLLGEEATRWREREERESLLLLVLWVEDAVNT